MFPRIKNWQRKSADALQGMGISSNLVMLGLGDSLAQRIAQIGFALRALMSVTLFGIGAYMVITSFQYFLRGELNTEAFFGPGVAFVAGLGTMLTMVYTGPLRDIKKAVSDVGAADAAFMAYIHRLLQVSHTFSYYYLDGKATFDELQSAGDLIKDTLTETVKIIRTEADEDNK